MLFFPKVYDGKQPLNIFLLPGSLKQKLLLHTWWPDSFFFHLSLTLSWTHLPSIIFCGRELHKFNDAWPKNTSVYVFELVTWQFHWLPCSSFNTRKGKHMFPSRSSHAVHDFTGSHISCLNHHLSRPPNPNLAKS